MLVSRILAAFLTRRTLRWPRVLWLFLYMWEDETFASLLDLLKHY
jgi:hypothetical protein